MGHESVVVALISVIGGGTLVPLLYGVIKRRKPEERRRVDAREEERTAKAAGEAVHAVREVLAELRLARDADQETLAALREENADLKNTIRAFKQG